MYKASLSYNTQKIYDTLYLHGYDIIHYIYMDVGHGRINRVLLEFSIINTFCLLFRERAGVAKQIFPALRLYSCFIFLVLLAWQDICSYFQGIFGCIVNYMYNQSSRRNTLMLIKVAYRKRNLITTFCFET